MSESSVDIHVSVCVYMYNVYIKYFFWKIWSMFYCVWSFNMCICVNLAYFFCICLCFEISIFYWPKSKNCCHLFILKRFFLLLIIFIFSSHFLSIFILYIYRLYHELDLYMYINAPVLNLKAFECVMYSILQL